MIGTYRTIDDCLYRVFYLTEGERGKKQNVLYAECIESKTKTGSKFPIKEEDISRNLQFGSWKIES